MNGREREREAMKHYDHDCIRCLPMPIALWGSSDAAASAIELLRLCSTSFNPNGSLIELMEQFIYLLSNVVRLRHLSLSLPLAAAEAVTMWHFSDQTISDSRASWLWWRASPGGEHDSNSIWVRTHFLLHKHDFGFSSTLWSVLKAKLFYNFSFQLSPSPIYGRQIDCYYYCVLCTIHYGTPCIEVNIDIYFQKSIVVRLATVCLIVYPICVYQLAESMFGFHFDYGQVIINLLVCEKYRV